MKTTNMLLASCTFRANKNFKNAQGLGQSAETRVPKMCSTMVPNNVRVR